MKARQRFLIIPIQRLWETTGMEPGIIFLLFTVLLLLYATTRAIAVDMPNTQSVSINSWDYYRTSTDAIEAATGMDHFSAVPTAIQATIE